jgi:hypothetical protein
MKKMFEDIFNWELKRSPQQAFGFYICTLAIGFLLGALAGGSTAFTGGDPLIAGLIAGVIYCPIIAFKVLSGKNRMDPGGIALIIFTALIAYYVGAIFALMPVAYCSTLSKK